MQYYKHEGFYSGNSLESCHMSNDVAGYEVIEGRTKDVQRDQVVRERKRREGSSIVKILARFIRGGFWRRP